MEISRMDIQSNQQVVCTLEATTANGKPATLDGIPEWQTSNPAVASVHPDATGWTCTVRAVAPGQTTITAWGDAALDPTVQRFLSATLAVAVAHAEAAVLFINPGQPEDQVP